MPIMNVILYFLIVTVNRQMGKVTSIPALGSLRQEDQGFRASLDYILRCEINFSVFSLAHYILNVIIIVYKKYRNIFFFI